MKSGGEGGSSELHVDLCWDLSCKGDSYIYLHVSWGGGGGCIDVTIIASETMVPHAQLI